MQKRTAIWRCVFALNWLRMHAFAATLELIGVNPFVHVPEDVLADIFSKAGRSKGPIRVHGTVNEKPYQQTLVRYAGEWRLYINLTMLANSPRRIGEVLSITIEYNSEAPEVPSCPAFEQALAKVPEAQQVYNGLSPSRQKELIRYLCRLKNEESLGRNVERAIGFLLGKNRFVGREQP
ncbi:YdeI/OmpD-associated family protein [Hymenobacter latericus]|uniref:YdeI/OmpD-associated family protein n=1 Tax=Hymenobacter sp. YIM 151858-1 TaxID=2987688 RepID=UPI0022274AB5|nr:YdeI/OmpD-associated family protein [Hymenobacter sp. YIM 151858-1]UYZ59024.1 YdeI/OmpD-associated family protein [Hymenobacter sp. YIM 151858-1]